MRELLIHIRSPSFPPGALFPKSQGKRTTSVIKNIMNLKYHTTMEVLMKYAPLKDD